MNCFDRCKESVMDVNVMIDVKVVVFVNVTVGMLVLTLPGGVVTMSL